MKLDLFGTGACALAGILLAIGAPGASAAAAKKPAVATRPSKSVKTTKPQAAALPSYLQGITDLEIAPTSFTLDGSRASQHLVVMADTKDGATCDVTDRVTFVVANPKLAKVVKGVLYPIADGETRVIAKLAGHQSPASGIAITNSQSPSGIEFVNDVMPILAKKGCNSTACHGSPAGKGGLKLSLFGYEPELDYPALVKDLDGKRIDRKAPEKSLLIQKAVMGVPHGGGMRFKVGSPEYQTLVNWVKEGAPGIGELEARVRSVEVIPDQPWMPFPNATQRLAIVARMSDGTARDVTDKALYSSNDDAIAEVDEEGGVTARRNGETAIMVRYMGQVAISRVAVLPTWKLNPYPEQKRNNYIDELVQAKLKKLRIVGSDLCTDEEFVRRAFQDTCGIIPKPEEVLAFINDRSEGKRARLIDTLLERPEFVDLWTVKWNDTLRNNPRVTRVGLGAYAKWIREQVAANRPYNEFVHDLLTANGRSTDVAATEANLPPQVKDTPRAAVLLQQVNSVAPNPAANYFVVSKDPLDMTSATSQIFLGVRIECARCHNHPFEKWTQNDYYGLASFFSGTQVRGGNQLPSVVSTNPRAPEIRHPKTNEYVSPKPLDNADLKAEAGESRRERLADWVTSPTNPWFGKELVNRVWGYYFGRGIVEPVDDFRVTNPASNPELLDALAKDFVEHKFDVKHMHRVILNSRTYQQSSRPNQYNRTDSANFARFYPKRMMAEALYDSISQATGIFLQAPGRGGRRPGPAAGAAGAYRESLPEGAVTRVMQMPGLVPGQRAGGGGRRGGADLTQFLDTFGKPRREVVCECERSNDGTMGQALVLINGDEINDKIQAPQSTVQQLVRSTKADPMVVDEIYLSALSRHPDGTELNEAVSLMRSAKSRTEGIEDLMWSLLNSREFLFIH